MKIIDAHMHIGLGGYDAGGIIRSMDRQGVDQSWLLTWEELNPPVPGLHLDLPLEPLLEAHAKYPHRLVPFYAPDPASDNLEQKFEQLKGLGIRGCGELKVSLRWEDPLIGSYLEMVEQYSLPLVFHMEDPRMQYIQEKEGYFEWILERLMNDKFNGVSRYYITRFAQSTGILKRKIKRNQVAFPGILCDFAALENRIRQFPGIPFIGHGPDFWNHISGSQHPRYIHQKGPIRSFGIIDRLLEQYDNLYCDISGTSGYNAIKRDPGKSGIFLRKHAPHILYGTDNTGFPLMELLQSMKLGKEKMEMILHKNAMKAMGASFF